MSNKIYYWLVQDLKGELLTHGPYMSSDSRDKRWENVSGGTVHKFDSFSQNPDIVKEEFKKEELDRL